MNNINWTASIGMLSITILGIGVLYLGKLALEKNYSFSTTIENNAIKLTLNPSFTN